MTDPGAAAPASPQPAPLSPPKKHMVSLTPEAYRYITELSRYLSLKRGERVTISQALLHAAGIERASRHASGGTQ